MIATLILTLCLTGAPAKEPSAGYPKGSRKPDKHMCADMCAKSGSMQVDMCKKSGGTAGSCKKMSEEADKMCLSACNTGTPGFDPKAGPKDPSMQNDPPQRGSKPPPGAAPE